MNRRNHGGAARPDPLARRAEIQRRADLIADRTSIKARASRAWPWWLVGAAVTTEIGFSAWLLAQAAHRWGWL